MASIQPTTVILYVGTTGAWLCTNSTSVFIDMCTVETGAIVNTIIRTYVELTFDCREGQ